jgi:glycosyltransferase involved in cell wall biosynthesis
MPKISLCMITKNEEKFLKQCLESVKDLVDEMIIVDTGSTDKTKEIAKEFNAKIYDFEWINDFSAARNESLKHATGDWILIIDADETISKRDHKNIRKVIDKFDFPAFALIQRHYSNFDQEVKFILSKGDPYEESQEFKGWTATINAIRLFKNNIGLKFHGVIHETIENSIMSLGLQFANTDIPLHHFQHKKSKESHKEKLGKYWELLEKKEKEEPDNLKNLHDLAIIYLIQRKDYKKAFEYFNKIHKKEKDLIEPYLGIGMIYGKTGDHKKAAEIFSAGLQKEIKGIIDKSTKPSHIKNTLWFNLALTHIKLGNKEKARKIFTALLKTPIQRMAKKQLEKLEGQ